MRLPEPRIGEEVRIRERSTPFCLWPVGRGARREKLQPILFAADPWFLIKGVVDDLSDPVAKSQAEAFRCQARDFYESSQNANVDAAKPLLFYYCLLNLAKCFIVTKTKSPLSGRIVHGLSEQLPTTPGAIHGDVSMNPLQADGAFQKFAAVLGQSFSPPPPPQTNIRFRSQDFLAQILVGHRIFCSAENFIERFISVSKIDYLQDSNLKTLWLKARFERQDIKRLGYSGRDVSNSLSRNRGWRNIAPKTGDAEDKNFIDFEMQPLFAYSQRPSETLNEISRTSDLTFWQVVTSNPPYRKYYVYLNTPTQTVLNQLLSIYVSAFYFGSITRYKPEAFSNILDSKIGPFVHEFFTNQQSQFLYLIASEFLEQEISKAAIT